MPVLQYVHLDVFTNHPFTGNQLAVFLDAAEIDERRMQRIANEMAIPLFVLHPDRLYTCEILCHHDSSVS
jgi:trans-2,3-dihydro-3-hydroxyanthranilate isomerase